MSKPTTFDIYDFDKTIYDGDCSLDFYTFCVRRYPQLLGYFPYQVLHYGLFAAGLEDRSAFKARFFKFLRLVPDVEAAVERFWGRYYKNMKPWYAGQDHSRDIIISASPEFLLRPVADRLGVHMLIATRMNTATGAIDGKNCWGKEKVVRLRQLMPSPSIGKAHTDSLSDLPILALAREKYIVRGDKVLTLEAYAALPGSKKITIPDPID